MLSEIQRAFEIGFLIALPFLIIDLVVSAVLMSMGMMMVPPVVALAAEAWATAWLLLGTTAAVATVFAAWGTRALRAPPPLKCASRVL
jgi:hypothetical protein